MGGLGTPGVWWLAWHFAIDKDACLTRWVRGYLKDRLGEMVAA